MKSAILRVIFPSLCLLSLAAAFSFRRPNEHRFKMCQRFEGPVDIVFLLDGSSSMGRDMGFAMTLDFLKSVVQRFEVSPNQTRISVLQSAGYGRKAKPVRTEFGLNQFTDNESVMNATDAIHQRHGLTRYLEAVRNVVDSLTDPEPNQILDGLRGSEVPKMLFLLTDGRFMEQFDQTLADKIESSDIYVYAFMPPTPSDFTLNEMEKYMGNMGHILIPDVSEVGKWNPLMYEPNTWFANLVDDFLPDPLTKCYNKWMNMDSDEV